MMGVLTFKTPKRELNILLTLAIFHQKKALNFFIKAVKPSIVKIYTSSPIILATLVLFVSVAIFLQISKISN